MIHQIFFASCSKKILLQKLTYTYTHPVSWPLATFLSRVCFPDVVVDMQILESDNKEYIRGGGGRRLRTNLPSYKKISVS